MSAADDLRDLRDRLEKAANTLALSYEDAVTVGNSAEQARFIGKREGVLLALDYLRPVLAAYDATEGETGAVRAAADEVAHWLWFSEANGRCSELLDVSYVPAPLTRASLRALLAAAARNAPAPVAAGGATPDPTEPVWRCVAETGYFRCTDGDWRIDFPEHSRCGWVPVEGPTT